MLRTPLLPHRYRNPRPLGRGGMSEVYLAEDSELGRLVAVKLLDERLSDLEEARQRFLREARAAARLSGHPNIVTVYDVGETGSRPYIVMEYLPGGTVAQRAREEPVPIERALAWLTDAASALDAAHAVGIVHRDVKPSNLLLDTDDEAHVADFGIARVADATTAGLTAPGQVLGTAGYLSPEQALGHDATPASDRYGLAVVAFELLTGGRPFSRPSEAAEVAAHLHEPVPPASSRNRELSPAVDALFERALAKRPEERYASCRAFVRALELALESRGESSERTAVLPGVRSRPQPVVRRARVAPLVAGAVLVLAGVGGAAAGVLLAGGDGEQAAGRTVTQEVVETREVTETIGGATVVETVRETQPSTTIAETAPADASASDDLDAHALNDEGFELMRQGRYAEALPLLDEAAKRLRGAGPADPYEGWANYNLGYTLLRLGDCKGALKALRRSDRLQDRVELEEALAEARACD